MKVSELINELSRLPPDKEVFIDDADTGWALQFEVVNYENFIALSGDYSSGDELEYVSKISGKEL